MIVLNKNNETSNNLIAESENCHEEDLHDGEDGEKMNKHVSRVACQTCHIPDFARKHPTKMSWDWSEAQNPANLPKEKRAVKKDGAPAYIAKKGRFVYEKNVKPIYAWYNGTGGAYHVGQKIDPDKVTKLAFPLGSRDDGNSRIMPFKLHRGKQLYDTKNLYILAPKLFPSGKNKGEAYWKSYDWKRAAKAAEKTSGLKFSGEYGFTETVLYGPINHMVTATDRALKCNDCHQKMGALIGLISDTKKSPRKNNCINTPSIVAAIRQGHPSRPCLKTKQGHILKNHILEP